MKRVHWAIIVLIVVGCAAAFADATPEIKTLSLAPTRRFVRDGAGLKQVLDLHAEFAPGSADCPATIEVDGTSRDVVLKPDKKGSAWAEVYVDEVAKPATIEVTVKCGEQTKTASCEIKPQKHWKLYLQPSAHVDIGYTDYQERVAKRHDENMKLALDLCKKYPGFKWNTEAAWVEDNFLSTATPEQKADFIKYAREGRIGCSAIYANMLTGICSHESFIRNQYFAHNMSVKYGIPFDDAVESDVPTQVWTLPSVLAGSGIKYFSSGANIWRAGSFNRLFGKSPFYWQGPDGNSVLTWISHAYAWAARLGLTTGMENARRDTESYLKDFERRDYPYDAVLAFGGIGDNRLLDETLAKTVQEWNAKYAYPQIIFCRGPEFFQYVEASFKGKIPTIRGDAGVYWDDGAGSTALETGMVRQAQENLATAEKLSALTSSLFGAKYPKAEMDEAWKNALLWDEHTWGANVSVRQPEADQTVQQWKRKQAFAQKADTQSRALAASAVDVLASQIKLTKPSVVAFNPLSWPVSDWVTVAGKDGLAATQYVTDVPPLGYKVAPLSSKPSVQRQVPPGGVPVLENRYYKVVFDSVTGAIKSLYDKELKRELVDSKSGYGVNQYIYTSAVMGPKRQMSDIRDVTRDDKTPPAVFTKQTDEAGQTMRIAGSGYKTPELLTTVVLYDKVKRIDFVNTMTKDETTDREAGYFAFPFALDKPEWYVELPDGVVRPKKDMLPGGDMEWYCAQDFVAAADNKSAVVWTAIESPLITLGTINRETRQSPLPLDNGHLYAYVFNNYWNTNYKASQGGKLTFRFSLTSMPKYDPVKAVRFGQSVRNPLIGRLASSGHSSPITHHPASLCSVDKPNVVIQAAKQAETGRGLVVRLREVAGQKTTAILTLPKGKFKEAWSCNLVEDAKTKLPITNGKVKVIVPANGMATILVK